MNATTLTLLLNGLTLAFALGLLVLVLWQDSRSAANRHFALFVLMVAIWSAGSLLGRAAAYTGGERAVIRLGLRLLDFGYVGSSLALYVYAVIVTGVRGRLFRLVSAVSLAIILAYVFFLVFVIETSRPYEVTDSGLLSYRYGTPEIILFLALHAATMFIVWRHRARIKARGLTVGILMVCAGHTLALISPRLLMLGTAEDVSALATLIMTYAIVRHQIMVPLLGRAKQLEAVRDVGLAISSRLRLNETLAAIAAQAAGLLNADGAAIYLKRGDTLELAAVYNMPAQFVGIETRVGEGMVGTVAVDVRARRLDHYGRDWIGPSDLPLARETFGAVLCVPLVFGGEVVGVLLVVQGQQGRLFDPEDLRLLELLGPQAAVAITNSRLFEAERELLTDLAVAKRQLEAVLTSTENPVIAVDRRLRVQFANPAASALLNVATDPVGGTLTDLVPRQFLPRSARAVLRDLRSRRVHVYEVTLHSHTYLCHVAGLGRPHPEGWVVVLNDVTELKELDRLKSQMIQMTSHDLKNPLQAAMSYMELLIEDGQTMFTADMEDYVEAVWSQLSRMYRLINSILDLERAGGGRRVSEDCDLAALLGRVAVDMAMTARERQVTLDLHIAEALPPVSGDGQQLSQAFANIVDNAIKFTPAGGRIDICASTNHAEVQVDVRDTGVGIPEEELPHVFERFYRGKQRATAAVGGSGLGLALVKVVVESHRGRVLLTSGPEKGTCVTVVLPAAAGTPQGPSDARKGAS
ncbi:MAG: ATP-binding protein [Anaerolineae bacterium]|nr:ATP-binding protein [Anaerolineae bacterium]